MPYWNSHYFYQPDEISILIESVRKLSSLPDCDNIVSELTSKIEKLFNDVIEKDYSKTLGNIVYYPNGLMQNKKTGDATIASPWLSSTEVKEKKKKSLHDFNFFKDTTLYYELRNYSKYPIKTKTTRYWNLASYLSKIEIANKISEKDKNTLKINDNEINNPYTLEQYLFDIADLFRQKVYFTKKNCEDLLLIYDTLSPNGENDFYRHSYYYGSDNLYEQVNDYVLNI